MTEPPTTLRRYRAELIRLATLAWPVVLTQIAFMLMGVVDTVMVGRLYPEALAGVSLGHTWAFAWTFLAMGTAFGLDPLVTQAHGARDRTAFDRAMAHGAVLLGLVSVPVTLMHLVAAPGLHALGQPEIALPVASDYAAAVAPSAWALVAFQLFRQGLQARGLMRPALWVALLGNVLNVPLNLWLMRGWGSWEGLGAVGVGWSTTVVRLAMLVALAAMASSDVRAVVRGAPAVSLSRLTQVARVALPVGVQTSLEVWAFSCATLIVGWFGEAWVAAHTVALNIASLAFMVPLGLSTAAATRVGNLLGAGRPWQPAAWTAISTGATVMLFSAAVLWFGAWDLAGVYLAGDPDRRALAASLLPVAAAFQVSDGIQAVAFGVLRGAGDTAAPSAINIVGFWLVGLPLGALLATRLGWEAHGVWVGLAVALTCVAALLLGRVAQIARRGGVRTEV